jgi:putative addiction module component (TIGR02574 family)
LDVGIPERIRSVENIWNSTGELPDVVTLTDGQRIERDNRLNACHVHLNVGIPAGVSTSENPKAGVEDELLVVFRAMRRSR